MGPFHPLARDRAGQVIREVAPARFLLALPEQPGQFLSLSVALIRDWRAQVPSPPTEENSSSYRYPPSDAQGRAWWMEGWQPTPSPSPPTEPKLIPMVTTAPDADPVALAQLYRQRWPKQENILKDWLLPLGLDTNHGFAKMPVEHSEIAKRRKARERRLSTIQRWAPKARERKQRASRLSERLWQETKAHSDMLYRRINGYICEHDRGNEREWRLQHKPVVKAMQAEADADLAERWRRYERVRDRQEREATKYTRYCLEQCDLLGSLAELAAKERAMYELENGKDQCMTVREPGVGESGHVGTGALVSSVLRPRDLVTAAPLLSLAGAHQLELRPCEGRVAGVQQSSPHPRCGRPLRPPQRRRPLSTRWAPPSGVSEQP